MQKGSPSHPGSERSVHLASGRLQEPPLSPPLTSGLCLSSPGRLVFGGGSDAWLVRFREQTGWGQQCEVLLAQELSSRGSRPSLSVTVRLCEWGEGGSVRTCEHKYVCMCEHKCVCISVHMCVLVHEWVNTCMCACMCTPVGVNAAICRRYRHCDISKEHLKASRQFKNLANLLLRLLHTLLGI